MLSSELGSQRPAPLSVDTLHHPLPLWAGRHHPKQAGRVHLVIRLGIAVPSGGSPRQGARPTQPPLASGSNISPLHWLLRKAITWGPPPTSHKGDSGSPGRRKRELTAIHSLLANACVCSASGCSPPCQGSLLRPGAHHPKCPPPRMSLLVGALLRDGPCFCSACRLHVYDLGESGSVPGQLGAAGTLCGKIGRAHV